MDRPWLTVELLFSAFWLAVGVFATNNTLGKRRGEYQALFHSAPVGLR